MDGEILGRLVVDGLDAVAWPAVAAVALLTLRKQLRAMVDGGASRLSKARLPGGFEFEFTEALAELGPTPAAIAAPVEEAAEEGHEAARTALRELALGEYRRLRAEMGAVVGSPNTPSLRQVALDLDASEAVFRGAQRLDGIFNAALTNEGMLSDGASASAFIRLTALMERELRAVALRPGSRWTVH